MYSRRDKSMRWISVNCVYFFVGFENSCHTQNRSWMFYIRITSRDHANGGKKYAASMLTKFLQSILKSILKVKSVPLSSITVLWVIKNRTRTVAQWLSGKREVYDKPSSHKETPKYFMAWNTRLLLSKCNELQSTKTFWSRKHTNMRLINNQNQGHQ